MRYPLAPKRGKGIVHLQSPCTCRVYTDIEKRVRLARKFYSSDWRGAARRGREAVLAPLVLRRGRGRGGGRGEEKKRGRHGVLLFSVEKEASVGSPGFSRYFSIASIVRSRFSNHFGRAYYAGLRDGIFGTRSRWFTPLS